MAEGPLRRGRPDRLEPQRRAGEGGGLRSVLAWKDRPKPVSKSYANFSSFIPKRCQLSASSERVFHSISAYPMDSQLDSEACHYEVAQLSRGSLLFVLALSVSLSKPAWFWRLEKAIRFEDLVLESYFGTPRLHDRCPLLCGLELFALAQDQLPLSGL